MEKKFLALDIGQVCLAIQPERCFARLGFRSAAEVPLELLRLSVDEFECGRLSDAEFLAAARKLTGTTLSDAELAAALAAIIGGPLPGMNELVFSLPARGIQPVFFSDTSACILRRCGGSSLPPRWFRKGSTALRSERANLPAPCSKHSNPGSAAPFSTSTTARS